MLVDMLKGLTRLTAAVVIALSTAVVVAPIRASVETPSATTPGRPLDGRSLVAASVVGRKLVRRTELILSFEDGYVTAEAGCNYGGGPYRVRDGRLRLSVLERTDMGCGTALERQDDWYFGLVRDAKITQRGSRIFLRQGRFTITFVPALDPALPDAIIDRVWILTGLKMRGESLRALGYRPAKNQAPGVYLSNRSASLRGSCASAYPDIRIRPAAATIRFLTTDSTWIRHDDAGRCGGARGRVDRAMRAVLRGRTRIQRTADHLTLRRGGNVLRFERLKPQAPNASPAPTSP